MRPIRICAYVRTSGEQTALDLATRHLSIMSSIFLRRSAAISRRSLSRPTLYQPARFISGSRLLCEQPVQTSDLKSQPSEQTTHFGFQTVAESQKADKGINMGSVVILSPLLITILGQCMTSSHPLRLPMIE